MTPLAPAQKSVLRIRGLLMALPLLVFAAAFDFILFEEKGVPFGFLLGTALAAALFLVLFVPQRRYRAWAFLETEDELHVQHGVWMKSRTIVPFGRVQHIDVTQGPVERRYGLGTLILHTAGTRGSAVSLPGLLMEDAERMRDEIRGKIRQDLV